MQCKALRESGKELAGYNVALFGASTDAAAKNKKFAEKLGLKYPLLSDTNKKVAKDYGILMRGRFASRVAIIVDKDGKIAHIEKKVNIRNHGKQLVDLLEKCKVEKKTAGDESKDSDKESEESEGKSGDSKTEDSKTKDSKSGK
jgi:peroxiredoxin Q/BCP